MKKQPTYKISLTFALLLFTIPLIYAVFCKVNGYIILPRMFIVYSVISLIAFSVASIFVFVKAIPGGIKVMFTFLILVFTAIFSLFSYGMLGHVEFDVYEGIENINAYNESLPPEENRNFFEPYVETESYGEFEDVTYYHYLSTGMFQQMAETTIIKYDEVNFQKETDKISSEKYFYEKSADVFASDPVPVFSFAGFNFRLEKRTEYWYPKEMNFVGINEETKEIVYVHFFDFDLDSVWDFADLLDSYCGWRYVIKDREKNK